MTADHELPEASFGKVGCSIFMLVGFLCVVFGTFLVLPIILIIAAVIAPFVILICLIRFVTSIAVDEVDQQRRD